MKYLKRINLKEIDTPKKEEIKETYQNGRKYYQKIIKNKQNNN